MIFTCILFIFKLYRHRVYDYQVYPIGMSDMRLIDNKVSTTWCQVSAVKDNSHLFVMSRAIKWKQCSLMGCLAVFNKRVYSHLYFKSLL